MVTVCSARWRVFVLLLRLWVCLSRCLRMMSDVFMVCSGILRLCI